MSSRVVILKVVAACSLAACGSRESVTAGAVSGCYVLEIGAWEPPLRSCTVPSRIELADSVIVQDSTAARPASRVAFLDGAARRGTWIVVDARTVQVWLDPPWPAGVKLELRPKGSDLSGYATFFQDVRVPRDPRAPVFARRTNCRAHAA